MRASMLALAAAGAFASGGCAASLAASAIGAAVQASQGRPEAIANLGEAASAACRAHSARFGEVKIIDVNLRGPDKAVVWGTVESGGRRQSFECRYNGKVAGFRLRPIRPRSGGSAG
ncbi:MAG TPA: hypothetical protein VF759_08655 [Allosphingosinicella sp.]